MKKSSTISSFGYDPKGQPEEYKFTPEQIKEMLCDADQYQTSGLELDPDYINDIGCLFDDGIGIEKDVEKAVYWYSEAIAQGENFLSGCNLGDIYRKGKDTVAKDLEKAFKAYFTSSHPYALFRIGEAYENGYGTEKDMESAKKYYSLSAQNGHRLGIIQCKRLNIKY